MMETMSKSNRATYGVREMKKHDLPEVICMQGECSPWVAAARDEWWSRRDLSDFLAQDSARSLALVALEKDSVAGAMLVVRHGADTYALTALLHPKYDPMELHAAMIGTVWRHFLVTKDDVINIVPLAAPRSAHRVPVAP